MCELRPGPRCASDTCENASLSHLDYQAAHPAGPQVDPITYAQVSYAARLTGEQAKQLADERAATIEYRNLLADRDILAEDLATARQRLADAKAGTDGARIIAANAKARDLYFDQLGLQHAISAYRNETATMLSNIDANSVYFATGGPAALGDAKLLGEHRPGSTEWDALRHEGLTGSDAAAILVGGSDQRADAIAAKVAPLGTPTREDVEATPVGADGDVLDASTPWAMVTAAKFTDEHPEYHMVRTDGTYQRPDEPWQTASPGVLLLDPMTGTPDAILMTKVSDKAADWRDGIPADVRAQALHNLHVTGLSHAHVAVLIDSKEYRSFRINADEVINPDDAKQRTYADRLPEMQKAWTTVTDRRAVPHVPRPQKYNFKGSEADLSQLAAYRGESVEQTSARLNAVMAGLDDGSPEPTTAKDRDARLAARTDLAYRTLLSRADPSRARFAVVDLETTGFQADRGEPLEVGITVRDGYGAIVREYQEVFSIDERFSARRGTGAYGVHGISLDETRGKRTFKQASREIADVLGIGSDQPVTLVAHNASFETQWLDANLPGFRESREQPADQARRPQLHVLDTKWLSERVVHSTSRNTLEAFTTRFGIDYSEPHRALTDANMTAEALQRFRTEVWANGTEKL